MRRATGARNQQTGRAGEYFVAAELSRRGAYAVTFAGNMPRIDILASNVDRSRTVSLQVKTRRAGNWQTSIDEGKRCRQRENETHFWVFVDLVDPPACPVYYVVPCWWIRRSIYREHHAYLARKGGVRSVNPASKHHSITAKRIREWKDRWDLLGLF
jgi:Holliday junction resolvase-like predicted endonuclease